MIWNRDSVFAQSVAAILAFTLPRYCLWVGWSTKAETYVTDSVLEKRSIKNHTQDL